MNHAVWCSLHQRPGLQDFLQRLISGHSTHGVADIASCSLSADPLLAAQSVGAIDTDNFDPANTSSKLVSRGLSQKISKVSQQVNGFPRILHSTSYPSLLAALGTSQTAVCPSTSIQEPNIGAQPAPLPVQHRATVAKTR